MAAWCSCFQVPDAARVLRRLRSFGVRVVKPSPVLKACSPLLDHKDKSVRDGAKELAVSSRKRPRRALRRALRVASHGLMLQLFLDSTGGAHPMAGRCGRQA